MIRNFLGACLVAMLAIASPAQATIKVLATTADWGALATEPGGDKVNVYTATNALQDVHQVDAKPSLVARARTADLVVANGAATICAAVYLLQRRPGLWKRMVG